MKETNLEHYKKELKKIFNENYKEPGNILFKIKKELNNDESIKTNRYFSTYTDDILDWMVQPYKEPILDDVERKYLSSLLKPFKSDVVSINKIKVGKCNAFLFIKINSYNSFSLPSFKSEKMYRNMELNKEYTLEELGL